MQLTANLSLPADTVTRTLGILAQKGSGKTYTAMKLTELMLAAGHQVVALDPTGVWWGLRAAADGSGKGFPIIVLGGSHGDAPLESTAGAVIADFVVSSGHSVVLDLSAFNSNAEQTRFVTDFAERLFRAKAAHRTPLHLMLDEADSFAPQRPMPGEQRMLGAFEGIVRRGRSRGLGMTMISQRPACVNKNVLTQVDLLIALRIVGIQDHKALGEWTALHGTRTENEQFLSALPSLPVGHAFFWSPGWLGLFQQDTVLKRTTFDSSRTPDPGTPAAAPQLAPVNLAELSAEILATVEQAKQNDPKALKARIATLEAQLAQKEPTPPVWTEDDRALLHQILTFDWQRVASLLAAGRAQQWVPVSAPSPVMAPARPAVKAASASSAAPAGGMQRMMIALAQRPGLSARQLGVRAGLSSTSGTFGTYLGKLRSQGWLEGTRDSMQLTAAGRTALGDYEPLPTGQQLLHHWLQELGESGANRMLQALARVHPCGLTKAELGEQAGISSTSGTFGTYLGKLRTLELIETRNGLLHASPEFFT
jgi:hypothetical protein